MLHRAAQRDSQKITFICVTLALLHALGGLSPLFGATGQPTGEAPKFLWLATALWLLIYLWSGCALIYHHGLSWLFWLVKYKPIVCICLVAAPFSFLWSLDPVLTIERSVHLIGTCLFAIFVGYHLSLSKICDSLSIALAITIICGFVFSMLFPDLGRSTYDPLGGSGREVWVGIQGNKNGFASTTVLTILLFLALVVSERYSDIKGVLLFICFISLLCLYFSHSATSTIALLVGLAMYIGFVSWRKFDLHIMTILLTAFAVVLLGFVALAGLGVELFDQETWFKLVGRSADFTGRADIWGATWELIKQHSFLGLGYGTIWFPRAGLEYQQQALLGLGWTAFHAHNGFLQVASQLGLPLAILSTWFVFSVTVGGFRLYFQKPSPVMLFAIMFYIVFLIQNLFEVSIFIDRSFYWVIFLSFAISTLRSYQALRWSK